MNATGAETPGSLKRMVMRCGPSDELFADLPRNPSRATLARRELKAWMKETGVWTHYARGVDEPWTAFSPDVTFERVAAECDRIEQSGQMVNADSEREACRKLAVNLGLHFPGDVATPNDPSSVTAAGDGVERKGDS